MVLGMDPNEGVLNGFISNALANVVILEAVISNHKGESNTIQCARNMEQNPFDGICISFNLEVFCCGFLHFHNLSQFNLDN